ncbi:outer membrane beta-barrel protein [Parafilimonas sp.]|uniref:outer membrane beta-barrel protein n=1 Tax=Parafilimonas sp. TaxID=1969739 RepID=UPI0039E32402
MKRFMLPLLLSIYLLPAQAQKRYSGDFSFAAGLNLGFPVGDFSDSHSVGLGFTLEPEYHVNNMFSIYGSTGFTNFFGKTVDLPLGADYRYKDQGMIPIVAGPKINIAPQFFLGAKLGVAILTGAAEGTGFNYQPQLGYEANKFIIDFGYNGISKDNSTLSSFSLDVLYKFN